MTSSLALCTALQSAEDDLSRVIQLFIAAEPQGLCTSQGLLENLIDTFSRIQASVRLNPSLAVKEALTRVSASLSTAQQLSQIALSTLNRQVACAGLSPAEPDCNVHWNA